MKNNTRKKILEWANRKNKYPQNAIFSKKKKPRKLVPLRYIALRSEEALTSKVHFTLSSKLAKIKKIEQFGKNPQN